MLHSTPRCPCTPSGSRPSGFSNQQWRRVFFLHLLPAHIAGFLIQEDLQSLKETCRLGYQVIHGPLCEPKGAETQAETQCCVTASSTRSSTSVMTSNAEHSEGNSERDREESEVNVWFLRRQHALLWQTVLHHHFSDISVSHLKSFAVRLLQERRAEEEQRMGEAHVTTMKSVPPDATAVNSPIVALQTTTASPTAAHREPSPVASAELYSPFFSPHATATAEEDDTGFQSNAEVTTTALQRTCNEGDRAVSMAGRTATSSRPRSRSLVPPPNAWPEEATRTSIVASASAGVEDAARPPYYYFQQESCSSSPSLSIARSSVERRSASPAHAGIHLPTTTTAVSVISTSRNRVANARVGSSPAGVFSPHAEPSALPLSAAAVPSKSAVETALPGSKEEGDSAVSPPSEPSAMGLACSPWSTSGRHSLTSSATSPGKEASSSSTVSSAPTTICTRSTSIAHRNENAARMKETEPEEASTPIHSLHSSLEVEGPQRGASPAWSNTSSDKDEEKDAISFISSDELEDEAEVQFPWRRLFLWVREHRVGVMLRELEQTRQEAHRLFYEHPEDAEDDDGAAALRQTPYSTRPAGSPRIPMQPLRASTTPSAVADGPWPPLQASLSPPQAAAFSEVVSPAAVFQKGWPDARTNTSVSSTRTRPLGESTAVWSRRCVDGRVVPRRARDENERLHVSPPSPPFLPPPPYSTTAPTSWYPVSHTQQSQQKRSRETAATGWMMSPDSPPAQRCGASFHPAWPSHPSQWSSDPSATATTGLTPPSPASVLPTYYTQVSYVAQKVHENELAREPQRCVQHQQRQRRQEKAIRLLTHAIYSLLQQDEEEEDPFRPLQYAVACHEQQLQQHEQQAEWSSCEAAAGSSVFTASSESEEVLAECAALEAFLQRTTLLEPSSSSGPNAFHSKIPALYHLVHHRPPRSSSRWSTSARHTHWKDPLTSLLEKRVDSVRSSVSLRSSSGVVLRYAEVYHLFCLLLQERAMCYQSQREWQLALQDLCVVEALAPFSVSSATSSATSGVRTGQPSFGRTSQHCDGSSHSSPLRLSRDGGSHLFRSPRQCHEESRGNTPTPHSALHSLKNSSTPLTSAWCAAAGAASSRRRCTAVLEQIDVLLERLVREEVDAALPFPPPSAHALPPSWPTTRISTNTANMRRRPHKPFNGSVAWDQHASCRGEANHPGKELRRVQTITREVQERYLHEWMRHWDSATASRVPLAGLAVLRRAQYAWAQLRAPPHHPKSTSRSIQNNEMSLPQVWTALQLSVLEEQFGGFPLRSWQRALFLPSEEESPRDSTSTWNTTIPRQARECLPSSHGLSAQHVSELIWNGVSSKDENDCDVVNDKRTEAAAPNSAQHTSFSSPYKPLTAALLYTLRHTPAPLAVIPPSDDDDDVVPPPPQQSSSREATSPNSSLFPSSLYDQVQQLRFCCVQWSEAHQLQTSTTQYHGAFQDAEEETPSSCPLSPSDVTSDILVTLEHFHTAAVRVCQMEAVASTTSSSFAELVDSAPCRAAGAEGEPSRVSDRWTLLLCLRYLCKRAVPVLLSRLAWLKERSKAIPPHVGRDAAGSTSGTPNLGGASTERFTAALQGMLEETEEEVELVVMGLMAWLAVTPFQQDQLHALTALAQLSSSSPFGVLDVCEEEAPQGLERFTDRAPCQKSHVGAQASASSPAFVKCMTWRQRRQVRAWRTRSYLPSGASVPDSTDNETSTETKDWGPSHGLVCGPAQARPLLYAVLTLQPAHLPAAMLLAQWHLQQDRPRLACFYLTRTLWALAYGEQWFRAAESRLEGPRRGAGRYLPFPAPTVPERLRRVVEESRTSSTMGSRTTTAVDSPTSAPMTLRAERTSWATPRALLSTTSPSSSRRRVSRHYRSPPPTAVLETTPRKDEGLPVAAPAPLSSGSAVPRSPASLRSAPPPASSQLSSSSSRSATFSDRLAPPAAVAGASFSERGGDAVSYLLLRRPVEWEDDEEEHTMAVLARGCCIAQQGSASRRRGYAGRRPTPHPSSALSNSLREEEHRLHRLLSRSAVPQCTPSRLLLLRSQCSIVMQLLYPRGHGRSSRRGERYEDEDEFSEEEDSEESTDDESPSSSEVSRWRPRVPLDLLLAARPHPRSSACTRLQAALHMDSSQPERAMAALEQLLSRGLRLRDVELLLRFAVDQHRLARRRSPSRSAASSLLSLNRANVLADRVAWCGAVFMLLGGVRHPPSHLYRGPRNSSRSPQRAAGGAQRRGESSPSSPPPSPFCFLPPALVREACTLPHLQRFIDEL